MIFIADYKIANWYVHDAYQNFRLTRGPIVRRFAAAALTAAALSATLFGATGTANAAAAGTPAPGTEFGTAQPKPGHFSALAGLAAPKPSSKKHYFQIGGVSGSYTSGDWYWTRGNGPFKIIVELNIHDTKRDGKVAGLAVNWTYRGNQYNGFAADTRGAGTSVYYWTSFVPEVRNIRAFAMVGTIRATPIPGNPNHHTFYYTARGPWVTIRS